MNTATESAKVLARERDTILAQRNLSFAAISVDEYKKNVAPHCGSLMCPSMYHDSTRHFDKKYIKKECGIACGEIKRILVMTENHPLFVRVPNKRVKYAKPMFASGRDEGSRPSERFPGMYVTDHPMGDVVIVVANDSILSLLGWSNILPQGKTCVL